MAKKILKSLTNNFGFKLLAFVFAFMLWLVVYNIEDPVITRPYTAIVSVKNEDKIKEMNKCYEILDASNVVSFSVSAKRSIIEKLEDSDFTAVADMNNILLSKDKKTAQIRIDISSSRYSSLIKYSGKSQYLNVALENLLSKQFVITPNTDGVVADGQIELGEFLIESIEPVIECPKGLASLCSSKHILCTSLGNGIPQCRVDGHKFRGRLYVEVVHRHGGNDTLRIVGHRFSQVTEVDEDAYTVIIQCGTGFQCTGIAVHRLQIGVVLLFPLVNHRKLGCNAVLKQCGLLLVINLGLDLTIDEFIAFCQCHIFQRIA